MSMGGWANGIRPITETEMGFAFGVPVETLKALLKRQGLAPSFVVEGVKLYQGKQARAVYAAVREAGLLVLSD